MTLALLVSGCATMGKNECLNAEWQSIGYEDGAKGYLASRIGEHRKACAKYNVTPDLAAYTRGRQQGLREWCVPSNGYYQGTRGAVYNGVCPEELETDFQLAMSDGRAVYDYRRKIKNHEDKLAVLHKNFDAIDAEISSREAELISDTTSPERRRALLDEIRSAESERELIRNDIASAEFNLAKMRRNLRKMETRKSY